MKDRPARKMLPDEKRKSIPYEKWFAKKYEPFFIRITDSQGFAKSKIRKPLAIEYKGRVLVIGR